MGRKERRNNKRKSHLNKTRKQVKANGKILWILGGIVTALFIATILFRN